MKRRDLEKELKKLGWYFLRHGGNHDLWTNGVETTEVPRHNEISESLAKYAILKLAKRFPGKGKK